jgi:hypothetical protein
MSTVIAKNVQVGTSGTATNNFTLYQPASPDGTVRLANGNSGTTTDLVTVTSAGNVGIGTSLPAYKLQVAGNFTCTYAQIANGTTNEYVGLSLTNAYTSGEGVAFIDSQGRNNVTDSHIFFGHQADYGSNIRFATQPAGTNTDRRVERARIDSIGNLLVGDTSGPSTNTRVYAKASTQDDNNGIIQAASASNSASIIAKTPIGTAQFFQWSEYGVRIGSRSMSGANAGAVYFSTGNDAVAASLDAGRTFRVGDVGPGAGGVAAAIYGGSGGDIVVFYQNRNNTAPYWYFNTAGGYGVFSDARLKTNIEPLAAADAVKLIKNIKPVEFNWTENAGDTSKRISGFLAQDVLANATTEGQKNILTNWETYDAENPDCPKMGLSDHRMLPSIVGTVQYLLDVVEQLKADVAALKAGQAPTETP